MFTVYPSAVVLLCLQLATATPVLPRQFTPTSSSPPSVTNSVSACATEAFQVSHFSISNIQGTGPKTISFFVSNPNLQLPEQVFCSYTFPNGTNSSAITSFNSYSCDHADTNFTYSEFNGNSYLWVTQNMYCDQLYTGASVWVTAVAIAVPPLPGYSPSSYDESDTGSVDLPIYDVALAAAHPLTSVPTCGQTCLSDVSASLACTGLCTCDSSNYADNLASCLHSGCLDGDLLSTAVLQQTLDYVAENCLVEYNTTWVSVDGVEEPIVQGLNPGGGGQGQGQAEPVRKV